MENASKALLIAGAILVCILLIGVGMLVFGSINGSIDEGISQMSAYEKDMFNSRFQSYEGEKVSGSNVRALINRVNSNNTEVGNDNKDPKYVTLDGFKETKDINTSKTYRVTETDTNNDGLIDNIKIEEATAKANS